jgi:hypothetical protein
MKKSKPSGSKSKNSNAMERLDSSCNKGWKGYSYVEEYMEIILFLGVKYAVILKYIKSILDRIY